MNLKPENTRIQKLLAQLVIASRRSIEKMIVSGEIKINGKIAELGQKISIKDKISIKNQPINLASKINIINNTEHEIILYHKPTGEICSRSDPKHKDTVFESLPKPKSGRWIQVGRLDLNTSGLLLFTTDGELANKLMHPKYELERVYLARVFGEITDTKINNLLTGVKLEDGMAKFTSINLKSEKNDSHNNKWVECSLKEGRNREVRRLWESQKCTINRLIRIKFGNVSLPKTLKAGGFVYLRYLDF